VPLDYCYGWNDRINKIKLALTIHRDFMQGLLYSILNGGAVAYLGHGRHGTCHAGRHFDGGA